MWHVILKHKYNTFKTQKQLRIHPERMRDAIGLGASDRKNNGFMICVLITPASGHPRHLTVNVQWTRKAKFSEVTSSCPCYVTSLNDAFPLGWVVESCLKDKARFSHQAGRLQSPIASLEGLPVNIQRLWMKQHLLHFHLGKKGTLNPHTLTSEAISSFLLVLVIDQRFPLRLRSVTMVMIETDNIYWGLPMCQALGQTFPSALSSSSEQRCDVQAVCLSLYTWNNWVLDRPDYNTTPTTTKILKCSHGDLKSVVQVCVFSRFSHA